MDVPIVDSKAVAGEKDRGQQRGFKPGLSRLINSPIMFICLTLLTVILACRMLYVMDAATRPPVLPGWDWHRHTSTMLICYRPGCGCAPDVVATAIHEAKTHGMEVLVLTDLSKDKAALAMRLPLPTPDLRQIGGPEMRRLNATSTTTVVRIKNERIVGRVQAASITPDFFK